MKITLVVDGTERTLTVEPGATLLEALRAAGYKGVKDGCAAGDCGACAVLVDGRAVAACFVYAARADGCEVTTVAGLAEEHGLHPLQQAFLDAGAVQCGFCIPGMLAVAGELLARDPDPSRGEVAAALAGNLCRCTGYVKQLEAVEAAARMLAKRATAEAGRG